MQDLPHNYSVTASAAPDANVDLSSPSLENFKSAPPAEFGGPGDLWSPETLLAAAVADCFVLTFRAVARASKLEWTSLACDVDAVLDRVEGVTRFTAFHEKVVLEVPAGTDVAKAERILHKAEQVCLVTNSLNGEVHLEIEVKAAG